MPILVFLMQILLLGVCISEMGPRPTGRILPNRGVFSNPTMVGIPMQPQGTSTTFKQKKCNESFHSAIQITDLCLLCKNSIGLLSTNILKGQPSNICIFHPAMASYFHSPSKAKQKTNLNSKSIQSKALLKQMMTLSSSLNKTLTTYWK